MSCIPRVLGLDRGDYYFFRFLVDKSHG
jgi:hypothetical protein